jgi:hypothetical protein
VKWTPNSPPTSLDFTNIHISPYVWQLSNLVITPFICHMHESKINHHTSITKHVSFKINFQQFHNSNVTAILLCLFYIANSIVTSSITSIVVANSIVTSSITSILRYLLLWTLDARCFRKYRFLDTLSYYLKLDILWLSDVYVCPCVFPSVQGFLLIISFSFHISSWNLFCSLFPWQKCSCAVLELLSNNSWIRHVISLSCENWRITIFQLEFWSENWRFFVDVFCVYRFIIYSWPFTCGFFFFFFVFLYFINIRFFY